MNLDQFATGFPGFKANLPSGKDGVDKQEDNVVLAGTLLETTDESYFIDINGVQYEIASSDVIDIQAISPKESSPADRTDDIEPPNDEAGVGDAVVDRMDVESVSEKQGPGIVLIRVNRNAVLGSRIAVQAALLAAVGTWMQVVLPAAEAA
jgi:hypothetical protein